MSDIETREYPCPKCTTGELYDSNAGGMFGSVIECDNSDCGYTDVSDLFGCVGDIYDE